MSDRIHLPPLALPVEGDAEVRRRATTRLRQLGTGLLVGLALVGMRVVQLAVWPSDATLRAAAVQRWDTVMIQAGRGDILDRNGKRLAASVSTPQVIADPSLVRPSEVDELATTLARLLGVDEKELRERLGRSDSRYQRLASKVHPSVAKAVEELDHRGIYILQRPVRFYPEGALAGQIVGFVNNENTGREGLEAAYDEVLRGGVILRQRRRDRHGLSVDDPVQRTSFYAGMQLHLTLDRALQRVAEQALAEVMKTSAPDGASAVVADVATGDLLAIANAPAFDPSRIGNEATRRRNRAVEHALEPGSVVKPLTVAAALDAGLVARDTVLDCRGPYRVGVNDIHDTHPMGPCTVADIIEHSSNVGAARLALDLGAEKFLTYFERFGVGRPVALGLPAEVRGFLRDAKNIQPIELATTAYGQGMSMNAVQLAMAIGALGNGGVLMRPRLVDRVVDAHGVPEVVTRPEPVRQVVSASVARSVVDMMVAVTETGTGPLGRVPGFRVAAKTGTAEKALPNGRGYGPDRVATFVALIPAENPRIAVAVVVDSPSVGSRAGGVAAAPAAATIMASAMQHLGVPPSTVGAPPSARDPLAAFVAAVDERPRR